MQGIFWNPPIEANFIGHIFAEIYKDKIYEPFLVDKAGLTIVDIGANIGLTSFYFSQFARQVYAIEPMAEHFDILKEMLAFNKIKNVKPIKKAIFLEDRKLSMGMPANNKTMASLHMATWPEGKPKEEVDCITLETLFNEEKIEHCDFMKVDVEGSEYEIFGSTSFKNVAGKIDIIVGEAHGWAGRNENQLKESFKNNGFNFEWLKTEARMFVARK